MTAIYDKLTEVLVTRFEVDSADIRPDVTFEDLEMDSLFLVELLVVLQSEIGMSISEDSATTHDTLEQAAAAIEAQISAARVLP
jgi:acyl carrier protein